ncbi:DUF4157 domain-containing protein [Deinococcus sp.]|uniref:eCIS core domain-containing protein n=1 Tax=Deinococcus sp. TaxID=47478 RepID=UPI0025BF24B8|nr:DUF4157 domain-containing protein [Deinococcus sp.]
MTERVHRVKRVQATPRRIVVPPEQAPADLLALTQQALQRFTARPQTLQRQAVMPVLRAAALDRQEQTRLRQQQTQVQRQITSLGEVTSAPRPPGSLTAPAKPTTPGDWVTVMRLRAEEVAGRPLDARSSSQFTALQRQVAQTLAQGFRSDRGDAQTRYAAYGEHLAILQRHPVSTPVARVVLNLIPPVERLPLQRAVDETLQRFQAQDQASLNFDTLRTLQRQLAELDAEATQPVLARIQARRGSGNPLPEAIQRHLEQGLNHDLSRVRIHDDAEADKLAKGVNAIAFTTGTDIFFRSGRFNPNTQSGLELLAHEVTHTVQQSQGRVGTGIDPDAGLEAEARKMGAQLAGAGPIRRADGRLKPLAPAASLRGLQRAPGSATDIAKWRKRLDSLNKELALDLTAAAADVAGLVDPTPISDGISAAISLARGDWLGAGLSIVSMIPGLGDAIAKPIKGSKLAAKIAKLEQEIRVVTAQLAKLTGRPLAALEAAAKASRKVVANEVLSRLPKNWPNVRGILGKKFDPRHLPAGYHVRTVGGKPVISRNKGLSDDDLYAPLTIDSKGNFALKTTSARLSNPTTMRNNYTRVYGPLKPGHQIHHLVPDNLMRDHALGQAAQRAGVDLDRARNLMGLPGKEAYRTGGDAGHWSSHPEFDLVVAKRMDKLTADLEKQFGSLDLVPRRIMQQTTDTLADQLRTLIKSGAAPMKDGRLTAAPHLGETVA